MSGTTRDMSVQTVMETDRKDRYKGGNYDNMKADAEEAQRSFIRLETVGENMLGIERRLVEVENRMEIIR